MTKFNGLKLMELCREARTRGVFAGSEPANYAAGQLARGADVIVVEGPAILGRTVGGRSLLRVNAAADGAKPGAQGPGSRRWAGGVY